MRQDRITTPAVCAHCGGAFFPFLTSLGHEREGRYCSRVCVNLARHGTPEERFWRQVAKGDDADCWLWTGRLMTNGYGVMGIKKRQIGAHRFSYELFNGPIPIGLDVLHNCPSGDCRRCVNPRHLWLGTQIQNNADTQAKRRHAHGERHGLARLTVAQVRAIRATHAVGGITQLSIAREYGISPTAVAAIVLRKTWQYVD
jgi:hypothetical protein